MSNNAALSKEVAAYGEGVDTRFRINIPVNCAPRWNCRLCNETTDINKVQCRWCKKDGRVRETMSDQLRSLKEYKSRKGDKKKPLDAAGADTSDGYSVPRGKRKGETKHLSLATHMMESFK